MGRNILDNVQIALLPDRKSVGGAVMQLEEIMIDILYLVLVIVFFGACYAMIKGLEKL